ncbi:MAG: enoyl-CoA hydratase/carnithine racemase [Candidatus Azotimanducaceae bacterium]|jgi:enoyl-CoA hydratase/carnithine racemase
MMYTSKMVSGIDAAKIGLAEVCVDDDELESTTLDMARQIVTNS